VNVNSAVNPFQVDLCATLYSLQKGNALVPSSQPSPNITTNPHYIPNFKWTDNNKLTADVPMTDKICSVLNNYNYNQTASIVHFEPLCDNFRVMGVSATLADNDPQNLYAEGTTSAQTGIASDGTSMNLFDTSNPYNEFLGGNSGVPNSQSAIQNTFIPAYQVSRNTTSINPVLKRFMPFTFNVATRQQYHSGLHGTNEFSLIFDTDNNQFQFQFLHSEIQTAQEEGTGVSPSIVKTTSQFVGGYNASVIRGNFQGGRLPASYTSTGAQDASGITPYNFQSAYNRVDINDRDSGIILTSLTSKNKNGVPTTFWSDLGFVIDDIVLPASYLQKKGSPQASNITPIPFDIFQKYTTGSLYSQSLNENQLLITPKINNLGNVQELVPIPDDFTMNTLKALTSVPAASSGATPTDKNEDNIALGNDLAYAVTSETSLNGTQPIISALNSMGGIILLEITGYGSGSELQDKDAFAVKSIVSLYYLNDNTFLSTTGDNYTYYHLSSIPQTISSLKVRILNPITKKKLTNFLGNNNAVYLNITQNKTVEI
jgi:hypothetical protein